MSQKWPSLRKFLLDLVSRLDNESISFSEIIYIGYLRDLFSTGREIDQSDEMKRIIALGMLANYALQENNLSNKNAYGEINS